MKKCLAFVAVIGLVLLLVSPIFAQTVTDEPVKKGEGSLKVFNVYTDKKSPDNHYIPAGWMGDHGDIVMGDQDMDSPHSGTTCIKFTYSGKKTQKQGWVGVYWQNPPNNWGARQGGFNLTGLNKLTFWAKGARAVK